MTTLNNLKKLLISGMVALTLIAVVACSGNGDSTKDLSSTNSVDPTTEQTVNVVDNATNESADDPAVVTDSSAVETNEDDSLAAEPIQAAFDGEVDEGPTGDIPVPEVAEPEATIAQLTPAEIVEAQSTHLADIYEDTVASVVYIVARSTQGVGSGSGFVWDTEGHIVTNYHVIQSSSNLTVKFFNGREYRADVVAFDRDADLAVIKLRDVEHELVPIAIGSSSELRPGELTIALGNPFSNEFTMTTGIVSAVSRTLNSGFSLYRIPSVVQTDAAINPGNSGGPLVNGAGEVIGINTAIIENAQSIGFAISIDSVKPLIEQIRSGNGDITPDTAFLGVTTQAIDAMSTEARSRAGINTETGALVVDVVAASAAANAGIAIGDVIVAIGDEVIDSPEDVARIVRGHAPDEEIVVAVERSGTVQEVAVTLGARGD